MKRNIDAELNSWKESRFRKPLIVRGARQVGKTYSVKKFGSEQFDNYVVFDFERDRTLHKIFDNDLSPVRILAELEVHANQRIIPGATLLFFDEIQECERALLSLRYFYEEKPELHVVAAGSMLEFALGTISFPVGRVTFMWMRPMTFYEFLVAGKKELLAEKLPVIFDEINISESVHLKIIEELKSYFITGGLPEAVKRFIATGSFKETSAVHEDIYQSYLQSLVKYNRQADMNSLDHLLRTVPLHVGGQIKFTRLDPDRRIEKTKASLRVLEKALLIQMVQSVSGTDLPLGAAASQRIIKPLFLDIGLMQHICGINPADVLNENDLSKIYKGALAEQFIGQELLAAGGSENSKVYYWARAKKNSSAELDYLFVKDGEVLPVEVKSGPAGKLKSMHIFLKEHPNSPKGYVMSPTVYDKQRVDRIVFVPIYSRFC